MTGMPDTGSEAGNMSGSFRRRLTAPAVKPRSGGRSQKLPLLSIGLTR